MRLFESAGGGGAGAEGGWTLLSLPQSIMNPMRLFENGEKERGREEHGEKDCQ
jgi:hypothetical protein